MLNKHKKLFIFLGVYVLITCLAIIPFVIFTDSSGAAIVFLVSSLILLLIINIWHSKTMKLKYIMSQEKNKKKQEIYEEALKTNKEQKRIMLLVFGLLAIITIAMIIYYAAR